MVEFLSKNLQKDVREKPCSLVSMDVIVCVYSMK